MKILIRVFIYKNNKIYILMVNEFSVGILVIL